MIAKKYIYLFAFSLIVSLSFFLTNLFYKDELYAKYSISLFDNALLPDNVYLNPQILSLEDYKSQLFDNCERKEYSSELLNFRFRKINSLIHLDFIFIEDNDKLNVEIENCINKSFANYKILIQEYFRDLIESSDMNEQFIEIVSQYLYRMDISTEVVVNIKKNLENKYSGTNNTKNLNDTQNDFEWLITYTKPNIINQDKILFKKNNINKISLFLLIFINISCFALMSYFIFKRK